MKKQMFAILGTGVLCLVATAGVNLAQRQATPAAPAKPTAQARVTPVATHATVAPALMPVDAQQALVKQYCSGCHNDTTKIGGMTLTRLDLAHAEQNAELAEKVIHQVKYGQMPKMGAARPDLATLKLFATTLETEIDKTAALRPNPGSRPFQRLTRTEYAKSIKDMLGIDVDVTALLHFAPRRRTKKHHEVQLVSSGYLLNLPLNRLINYHRLIISAVKRKNKLNQTLDSCFRRNDGL